MPRGISRLPAFCLVAVSAYVVGAYGATDTPIIALWRPLFIAVAIAALLIAIGLLVFRRMDRAGIAAGIALLALVSLPLALLPLWLAAAHTVSPAVRRQAWLRPARLVPFLNVATLIWLAVAMIGAAPQALSQPASRKAPFTITAHVESRPDIYLLLLDGYARGDTLIGFGYDNEPFLQALEARGFEIHPRARGSYEFTAQVLAAMLQARHLPDLDLPKPTSRVEQQRILGSLGNDAPVLDELRDAGYRIVTSPPGLSSIAVLTADVVLVDDYPGGFEYHLLHETELDRLSELVDPSLVWRSYRDRVVDQFDHLSEAAGLAADGPQLTLFHVLAPHAPLTLRENAALTTPPPCFPVGCRASDTASAYPPTEFHRRYADQVAAVNALVLEQIDVIVRDPHAVVVIFSDHGSRYPWENKPEFYRTLFATRTPGWPGIFDSAAYPTAIFPVIARAYFGIDTPIPRFESYAMIEENLLHLRRNTE